MQVKRICVFLLIVGTLIIMMAGVIPAKSAYTKVISNEDATFDKDSDGDVTISVTYDFRLNNNYTTLKLYHPVNKEGETTRIGLKTIIYSNYVNGSNGTNGLVSKTANIIVDSNTAEDLEKDENILIYIKIYNGSIEADNLLKSDYIAKDWPYTSAAEEAVAESLWQQYRAYILGGALGIVLAAAAIIFWQKRKAVIP